VTSIVAISLVVLALLDGSFSGFRASVGRTGLINHGKTSRRAAARGAGVACLLLMPVAVIATIDAVEHHSRLGAYARAGQAMLIIYGPYAAIVVLALLAYALLGWQQKYLATAAILGPFTLLRPLVAVLGLLVAIVTHADLAIDLLVATSVVAVLAVEPIAGRLWYRSRGLSA
jgi:hypothetical protein